MPAWIKHLFWICSAALNWIKLDLDVSYINTKKYESDNGADFSAPFFQKEKKWQTELIYMPKKEMK